MQRAKLLVYNLLFTPRIAPTTVCRSVAGLSWQVLLPGTFASEPVKQ
jgi:hypothetical protein